MKLPISDRLLACAGFVSAGERVADVGCDHGYLSIYLLIHKIATFVIASDVREGPLHCALANSRKYGVEDRMRCYLSDGCRSIPRDFDVMICAGMGADTMIGILEEAPWLRSKDYRLILQCQSKTPMLRQYLSEKGWRIAREKVLRDGRFLYTVMEVQWDPEQASLDSAGRYFPPALFDNDHVLVQEYFTWVTDGIRIAAQHRADPEKLQLLAALDEMFDRESRVE